MTFEERMELRRRVSERARERAARVECRWCGERFTASFRNPEQRYCSEGCRMENQSFRGWLSRRMAATQMEVTA